MQRYRLPSNGDVMIYDALKLIFTGKSTDAACLIIVAAQYMTPDSCRTMADYLNELAVSKERRASKGKEGGQ